MSLSDLACPSCRRPRTALEIAHDIGAAHRGRLRRRVLACAAAGIAVAGIWALTLQRRPAGTAAASTSPASETTAPAPSELPAALPATPSPGIAALPVPRPARRTPPVGTSTADRPPRWQIMLAPGESFESSHVVGAGPGLWTLKGSVYDLKTLAPIPYATFEFRVSTRPVLLLQADANGRYSAFLPRTTSREPSAGYELAGFTRGYERSVFHETDVPYATLSLTDRKDLIDSARTGDARSTPLFDVEGESSRRLDLFLAPRPTTAPETP